MDIIRPHILRLSPYPGVIRDYGNGTGWWYYCVNCGYDYPLETAMNPKKADCCSKPSLHVWSNERDNPNVTTA